jgi:hypothetical protein
MHAGYGRISPGEKRVTSVIRIAGQLLAIKTFAGSDGAAEGARRAPPKGIYEFTAGSDALRKELLDVA